MPKLSELKKDEVSVVVPPSLKLSELGGAVKPVAMPAIDQRSTGEKFIDFLGNTIGKPAGRTLETIATPIAEADKVTGAPLRAAAGAFQDKAPMSEVLEAGVEQFKAGLPSVEGGIVKPGELLPTTPSGADMAFKGIQASGVRPEFAGAMAPMVGMAVDVALDPTMLIPGQPAMKAMRAAEAGAGKALGAAAKVASRLEGSAARAIARTGQVMTQGVLKADRALQMYKELSAAEMFMPGTKDFGRMAAQQEKVGAYRRALREQPITVPGSHDVAQQVKAMIDEAEYRSGRTPGSERMLKMIEERAFEKEIVQDPPVLGMVDDGFGNVVETVVKPSEFREVVRPRDLTLDELDDLVREADDLGYTAQGNPRSQPAKWAPTITATRRLLDESLQSVPFGEMFKEQKQKLAALKTAGTNRSRLVEAFSQGGTFAGGAVLTGLGGLAVAPAALVSQSLRPQAYVNMLSALKVPSDMAGALKASYQTGRLAVMRDTLMQIAEKSPVLAERIVRATALVAGKPASSQELTPEEADDLAAVRVFDPEQVQAEKDRLTADKSLSTVERAKKLSEINRNGYITLPPTSLNAEPETPTERVFGGEDGLKRLQETLERHSGGSEGPRGKLEGRIPDEAFRGAAGSGFDQEFAPVISSSD